LLVVVEGYLGPRDGLCTYDIVYGYKITLVGAPFYGHANIGSQDISAYRFIVIVGGVTRVIPFVPVIIIIIIPVIVLYPLPTAILRFHIIIIFSFATAIKIGRIACIKAIGRFNIQLHPIYCARFGGDQRFEI